jgi:uncharacterized membrane protein YjfL (UPF0719 family)
MTTLGTIQPAALALFALADIFAFRVIHSQGGISQKSYAVWGAAAIALPIIAYVVLNLVMPEWGAKEIL